MLLIIIWLAGAHLLQLYAQEYQDMSIPVGMSLIWPIFLVLWAGLVIAEKVRRK